MAAATFTTRGHADLPRQIDCGKGRRSKGRAVRQFLQADPIGYGDGMNWYAYVGNDPVNSTDPTGLAAQTWVSGWVFAA